MKHEDSSSDEDPKQKKSLKTARTRLPSEIEKEKRRKKGSKQRHQQRLLKQWQNNELEMNRKYGDFKRYTTGC